MRMMLPLLCCVGLAACSPPPPRDMVITGQVFIQTKGGANEKLGGVRVFAVPAALAAQRESEAEQAEKREVGLAKEAFEAWEKDCEQKQAAAKAILAERRLLELERDRLLNILTNNAVGMVGLSAIDREKVAAANRECMNRVAALETRMAPLNAAADKAVQTAREVTDQVVAGPGEVLALVPRLAQIKWPEAVAEATSDADGRFSLRAKPGDYALVASGMRDLILKKEAELFFWRVPVPSGEQPQVMLNAANARTMTGYLSSRKKADAK